MREAPRGGGGRQKGRKSPEVAQRPAGAQDTFPLSHLALPDTVPLLPAHALRVDRHRTGFEISARSCAGRQTFMHIDGAGCKEIRQGMDKSPGRD